MQAQTETEIQEWCINGVAAYEQDLYQEAIIWLEKCKEAYERLQKQDNDYYRRSLEYLGNSYHEFAVEYYRIGDYAKAVEYGTQAVEIYRSVLGERHPYYVGVLSNLAVYYSSLGDYAKAVEVGTQAMEIRRSVLGERHPDYATSLNNLALNYSRLGDYSKAVEYGTQAMEILRSVLGEQHPDYATTLHNLVSYHFYLGDYSKAVEYGTQAMEIFRSVLGEQHPDYTTSLNNLALNYSRLGDYSKAVEYGTQAMEILRSVLGEQHPDYAASLHNLASYYFHLGDYSKAVEYGTQAMEILRSVLGEQHPSYAQSLSNLAGYYSSLGDYSKAVELGSQSLEIRRSVYGDQHPDFAQSLGNLAIYYHHLGDYSRAVEYGTQAMEVYRSVLGDQHPDYAVSLNNLATYYSSLGDYFKAVELGSQALEIRRSVFGEQHPDYAHTLNELATYYSHLGVSSIAVELGSQALEIRRTILGDQHPDYANSLNNLAEYYSHLGDYSTAVEYGVQALEIRRSVLGDQHPDYANSLHNLTFYFSDFGDYSNTLKYYSQNISILQSNTLQQFAGLTTTQRSLLWAKVSYAFTDIYPSFAYLSHATTAPDLYDKSALFAKGLLLSTEIEMNRLIQESGDEEALRMFEELQLNRLQLQKLYETPIAERRIDTDSLAKVVDRQEQALVKRSAVYGDFTRKLRTTWQGVQQSLRSDEIAVEFLSFNVNNTDSTMVAALTLRKDDKEPKFIPLFELRQLLSVSDPSYYHCPELTDLVWKPLQQELKGVKRIYFSPAGALHNIGIEYAPGMEEYEMYRLSTTREIITHPSPPQGREMATTSTAALFGGIDYNTLPEVGTSPSEGAGEVSIALHRAFIDSLDIRGAKARIMELPGTKTEVENIKRSFDNKHWLSTLCMGAEATETAVKGLSGTKPKIFHIATHGFYFTEKQTESREKQRLLTQHGSPYLGGGREEVSPEDKALTRSGLLFAGANLVLQGKDIPLGADDGILTAQEISRLDLRGLDLVVLSACKTGNGDINQGEGVFGLQRGFKKAGAQTLVMSLWEVADDATQILMTAFYDNMLQGQSKRDAFHNAQRILRTAENGRYDKPQFWAAFILLD